VLAPPWSLQRPFWRPSALQGVPLRVFAPHVRRSGRRVTCAGTPMRANIATVSGDGGGAVRARPLTASSASNSSFLWRRGLSPPLGISKPVSPR
jgi:hypothetical protein